MGENWLQNNLPPTTWPACSGFPAGGDGAPHRPVPVGQASLPLRRLWPGVQNRPASCVPPLSAVAQERVKLGCPRSPAADTSRFLIWGMFVRASLFFRSRVRSKEKGNNHFPIERAGRRDLLLPVVLETVTRPRLGWFHGSRGLSRLLPPG